MKYLKNVSGDKFETSQFRFLEKTHFDSSLVDLVLNGKHSGVIFQNYLPEESCIKIAENFWKSTLLYKRDTDAPAYYAGIFHFGKELSDYLKKSTAVMPLLNTLFDGTINPVAQIINNFTEYFGAQGIEFRLAEHQGYKASPFVMRSWSGTSTYSLLPHEDEAQCSFPEQADFEIQKTVKNPIVAVNICLQNTQPGGNLHYWNIMPDKKSREALGLHYTGSPYPIELLSTVEKQIIPIYNGDIYFFNGKSIHAVASLDQSTNERATISFLMAQLNEKTIIYWA